MKNFGWIIKGIALTTTCTCLSLCTCTEAQARDKTPVHESGVVDRAPDTASVSPPAVPDVREKMESPASTADDEGRRKKLLLDSPPDSKTPARNSVEDIHAPPASSTTPSGTRLGTKGYLNPDIAPTTNANANPAVGPGVLMNNPNNSNSTKPPVSH